MTASLKGTYAALLTGFDDAGGFCPRRQARIVDVVTQQQLSGLYIGGSSGESGLMSTQELLEQQKVIRDLRDRLSGTIIAHVGQPSLGDSVLLAESAATLGFEALSALPPHSYPFSDDDIFAYYRDLASATDLPMIVYEIPVRTGRALPTELLLKILDLPNVAGMKFTSTDLYKLSVLRRTRPDKLFFFGFDEMFVAAAALGCDGGIGTTYNVLGNLYTAAFSAVEDNDILKARALQVISQEYVDLLIQTGVVPGVKLSLSILGFDAGSARRPMQCRSADAEARLRHFLSRPDVRPWLAQEPQ